MSARRSWAVKGICENSFALPCYQRKTRAASKRRNTICFMRYYSRE